jgi:hypothetical protein
MQANIVPLAGALIGVPAGAVFSTFGAPLPSHSGEADGASVLPPHAAIRLTAIAMTAAPLNHFPGRCIDNFSIFPFVVGGI